MFKSLSQYHWAVNCQVVLYTFFNTVPRVTLGNGVDVYGVNPLY